MSTGNVQTGTTTAIGGMTAAQQQTAAVKALAAQITNTGSTTGIGHLQGALRAYQGRKFVEKPSWKPSMLFDKAAAASYNTQLAVFKEQRAEKHHFRLLNAVQQPKQNVLSIKRSMKFLRKQNLAGGAKIKDLLPLDHSAASSTQRIANAVTIKVGFAALLQKHGKSLDVDCKSYANGMVQRLDVLIQGMPTLDDVKQFRATDNGAYMNGLTNARTIANQNATGASTAQRSAAVQQFNQHGVGTWTDMTQVDWRTSPGGMGGVLLVYDKGTTNLLGVFKVDNSSKTLVSKGIGSILQQVHANSPTPLPFDFPMGQFIKADPNGSPAEQQLHAQLQGLITAQRGSETDPDLQDKCRRFLGNLDDAKGVTRYAAANGTEFNKIPIAQRIEYFHSDVFAEDLANVGVLAPFMGMNDHVGIICGNTNPQNLMLNAQGRTTVVDMEGAQPTIRMPDGTKREAFGFQDHVLTDGLSGLLADLSGLLDGSLTFESLVTQVTDRKANNKLAIAFDSLFDDHPKVGMLPEPGVMSDLISPQEKKEFMQRVVSKLGDKLTMLKAMAPSIAAAHDNEPTSTIHGQGVATMNQIVTLIDAFDASVPGGGLAALRNLAPAPRAPYQQPTPAVATTAPTVGGQGIVLPPIDDLSESA